VLQGVDDQAQPGAQHLPEDVAELSVIGRSRQAASMVNATIAPIGPSP
jgi:hypothetical protein